MFEVRDEGEQRHKKPLIQFDNKFNFGNAIVLLVMLGGLVTSYLKIGWTLDEHGKEITALQRDDIESATRREVMYEWKGSVDSDRRNFQTTLTELRSDIRRVLVIVTKQAHNDDDGTLAR